MKNSRKKDLRIIRMAIIAAKANFLAEMEAVKEQLDDLYMELEEQFDNLSERSQENEVGEKVQEDMESVDSITNEVEYMISEDAEDADIDVSSILSDIDDLLNY